MPENIVHTVIQLSRDNVFRKLHLIQALNPTKSAGLNNL